MMTKKLNARTMADYFEKRYNSGGIKILASVIIFIFLVSYSAAVYKGLGSLFSVVFPGVETWLFRWWWLDRVDEIFTCYSENM